MVAVTTNPTIALAMSTAMAMSMAMAMVMAMAARARTRSRMKKTLTSMWPGGPNAVVSSGRAASIAIVTD